MIHVHIYNMCVALLAHSPAPFRGTQNSRHPPLWLPPPFALPSIQSSAWASCDGGGSRMISLYHYHAPKKKTELKGTLWCGWETLSSSLALHLTGNMDTHSSWTLSESSKMLVQYWKSRFYLWGCYCIWICGKSLVGVKATEKPPLP